MFEQSVSACKPFSVWRIQCQSVCPSWTMCFLFLLGFFFFFNLARIHRSNCRKSLRGRIHCINLVYLESKRIFIEIKLYCRQRVLLPDMRLMCNLVYINVFQYLKKKKCSHAGQAWEMKCTCCMHEFTRRFLTLVFHLADTR